MFGWFRKQHEPPPPSGQVAHQRPGEVFRWPKGWRLTALDEAIIAVPVAIFSDDEVIDSVIHGDADIRLGMNSATSARMMIWLKPGQSVWLSRSCEAVVVPMHDGDTADRRFTLDAVVH